MRGIVACRGGGVLKGETEKSRSSNLTLEPELYYVSIAYTDERKSHLLC